jgi:SprT-like family protein
MPVHSNSKASRNDACRHKISTNSRPGPIIGWRSYKGCFCTLMARKLSKTRLFAATCRRAPILGFVRYGLAVSNDALTMPGLALTPEMLESAYEYLRVSPPFCRWGLPEADQVMFRVMSTRDRFGHFRGRHRKARGDDGFSEIAISAGLVRTTDALIATMAHEMIHLYQDETGTARGHHNPKFRKLAKRVCAIHGFDPENF